MGRRKELLWQQSLTQETIFQQTKNKLAITIKFTLDCTQN